VKDTCNPGCVDPASQSYPTPRSQPTKPTSRGAPATSNGEFQPLCAADVLSSPASSAGSGAVTQSTGEQQYLDHRPPDTSVSTSRGLPSNVPAGSPHPRGLPADVVVK
jgi:hypothetical protein